VTHVKEITSMSQQHGETIALHCGQVPDPTANARAVQNDDLNQALAKSHDAVAV